MLSVHPNQMLFDIPYQIAANDLVSAQETLTTLLENIDKLPNATQYSIFGSALANRLSADVAREANLYLANYDLPQIQLFNLLAGHVPQVSLTSAVANRLIAGFCRNEAEVTVIDVGIGTGRQIVELLERLHKEDALPTAMNIIGIEPSAWSLDTAQSNLQQAARQVDVTLRFHPICSVVEKLTAADWAQLRAIARNPIINASFALHHIQDIGGVDMRNEVLCYLRTLDPVALVLAEPNVNHAERDFVRRFHNCWNHFDTTFRVIDRLAIAHRDKDTLKVCFFGREITDILGNEALRTERHETTATWLQRLATCGYAPCAQVELPDISSTVIDIVQHNGYVGLDYDGETLVSVLCAVPFAVAETSTLPMRIDSVGWGYCGDDVPCGTT